LSTVVGRSSVVCVAGCHRESRVPIAGGVARSALVTGDQQYFVRSENQAGNLLLGEPLDGAGNRICREVSAVAAGP
jgi:hypothetical protein